MFKLIDKLTLSKSNDILTDAAVLRFLKELKKIEENVYPETMMDTRKKDGVDQFATVDKSNWQQWADHFEYTILKCN